METQKTEKISPMVQSFMRKNLKKNHIFRRYDWNAEAPTFEGKPPKRPIPILFITDTRSEECYDNISCLKAVRALQTHYMEERGYADIPWNYLVGGDGNIFEGRGYWEKPIKTDYEAKVDTGSDGESLAIAYIGNFQEKPPSTRSQESLDDFIDMLYLNFIVDKFKCKYINLTMKDENECTE